jgi:prevent-host-death family protein
MSTYTIAQAKDQLSRLVDAAQAGEMVTLVRNGQPVADITPRAALKPITPEYLAELRRARQSRPRLEADSVSLMREMRDERQ